MIILKRLKRWMLSSIALCLLTGSVYAVLPDFGGGGGDTEPAWLDRWSFENTNTWASDRGYAPMSFTNLDASLLGNWYTLGLDHTNAAWLQYKVVEADGTNHLKVERGSVMFWFAPSWSGTNAGGNGPGQWGRLIETGTYTTNASLGWWSLYTDPAGVNLYFGAQTNGAEAVYLAAPIAWTTNRWHLIALTYSDTNSALYLDGALATNGPGVTVWPGADALTNGLFVGSDSTGVAQARGMFDDLSTYASPLDAGMVAMTFDLSSFAYYLNLYNFANFSSGPSTPVYGPAFVAISGAGHLQYVGSNPSACATNSSIWFTNVSASLGATGSVSVTFTIAGGSNGVPYDVFASSILIPASDTNYPWSWMGQGYHCNTYTIPNLPSKTAFLILGTPTDSDFDGLTDAYEQLVSKTDPNNPDTDGDGMIDGWEIINGLSARSDDSTQSGKRLNYIYDQTGWLTNVAGIRFENVSLDAEGNVKTVLP